MQLKNRLIWYSNTPTAMLSGALLYNSVSVKQCTGRITSTIRQQMEPIVIMNMVVWQHRIQQSFLHLIRIIVHVLSKSFYLSIAL